MESQTIIARVLPASHFICQGLVQRWSVLAVWIMGLALVAGVARGQDEPPKKSESSRQAFVIRVPLPINQKVREQVVRAIDKVIEKVPPSARTEDRPSLILKFDTERGQTGTGSNLSDCMEMASRLTNEKLAGVRTVAYLPGLRNSRLALDPQAKGAASLSGHAVLVAIAAELIVIDPQATLGNALAADEREDTLILDVYRNIAARRLTVPLPAALSVVDRAMTLYSVTTNNGEELVDAKRLSQLEASGKVIQTTTLKQAGEVARFTASQLVKLSPNIFTATDKNDLAAKLKIDLTSLEVETAGDREWRALRFELPEVVDSRTVDWGIRAIEKAIKEGETNLVIVQFTEGTAQPKAALRLARYLAELDPDRVQTAALVESNLLAGPLAVVALSCNQLLLLNEASLGGRFSPEISEKEVNSLLGDLELIAEMRERDLGLLRSMLDLNWKAEKFQHRDSGVVRWMTAEQQRALPDAEKWITGGQLDLTVPITAQEAELMGITRTILASADELDVFYQLASPPVLLKPTRTDRMLSRFAIFLASPPVSFFLLMGAIMLLSAESSTPGLGVPGFLGTICIVLFFWSQYFDGNATWFEILLFVTGAVFVAVELFVLPGFGIFGFGGLLMMIVSIVLATQTFVFPQTQQDFAHLPVSLGMAFAAACGSLFGLIFLKRYAKHIPLFNSMMLEPPVTTDQFDGGGDENSGAWVGQTGITVTQLIPAGKAKFGGRILDVISEGTVIEPQTEIEIVEVMGNRIVVAPTEKVV